MKLGKPSPTIMQQTITRLSGASRPDVLLGPKPGVDVSVVQLGPATVMISSSDPISLIPALGPAHSAWLSVHAVASDVATSGVSPKYALFDLNLPPRMSDNLLRNYWQTIHATCKQLGISILGGHTGRFEGCGYSVVGGATMLAFGSDGKYVTSSMANDGDDLIATKSPALEAAVVLAKCFPKTVRKSLGRKVQEQCASHFKDISTVKDALVARSVGVGSGGVTAMHDVTEGGVASATLEMANASGLGVTIDADSLPVFDEVKQVCQLFKINPWNSLGQGSLLIASRPKHTGNVQRAMRKAAIASTIIGRFSRRSKRSLLVTKGRTMPLLAPRVDAYWSAYWNGIQRRLR